MFVISFLLRTFALLNINTHVIMTREEKISTFSRELSLIKDSEIRKFTEDMLAVTSDKFFTAPASSSGKYHNEENNGSGGLVRHTKQVVMIAWELANLEHNRLKNLAKDIVVSACILHDTCKCGINFEHDGMVHDHGLLVTILSRGIIMDNHHYIYILNAIESHNGQWTTRKNSDYIRPTPSNEIGAIVHEADYLASRRYITIDETFDITKTWE